MTAPIKLPDKYKGEITPYFINYAPMLRSGETLTQPTIELTGNLTLGTGGLAPTFVDNLLTFYLTTGDTAVVFDIWITATTSLGRVRILRFQITLVHNP